MCNCLVCLKTVQMDRVLHDLAPYSIRAYAANTCQVWNCRSHLSKGWFCQLARYMCLCCTFGAGCHELFAWVSPLSFSLPIVQLLQIITSMQESTAQFEQGISFVQLVYKMINVRELSHKRSFRKLRLRTWQCCLCRHLSFHTSDSMRKGLQSRGSNKKKFRERTKNLWTR